jgi:3-dehydroquinate synthase
MSQYTITHGEGVALGMIAAARLSEKMGYLESNEAKRIEALIRDAGLPGKIPETFSADNIIAALRMDKKKKGDMVRFVLLKKIGMPFIIGSIKPEMITAVIEEMKE